MQLQNRRPKTCSILGIFHGAAAVHVRCLREIEKEEMTVFCFKMHKGVTTPQFKGKNCSWLSNNMPIVNGLSQPT